MSLFSSSAAHQLMSIMGTFVPWKQLFFLAASNLITAKRSFVLLKNVDMFLSFYTRTGISLYIIIAWYCDLFGHLCSLLFSCLLGTSWQLVI